MQKKLFTVLCLAICLCKNLLFSNQIIIEPDMQTFLSEYYYSQERTQKEYSKLLYAIEKSYRNIAFKLLEKGEDPNYLSYGQKIPTPLILAVSNEDEELVSAMINRGANVNLEGYFPVGNSQIVSPLYIAAMTNNSEKITQILCDYGATSIKNELLGWSFYNPIWTSMTKADVSKFLIIANNLSDNEIKRIDSNNQNLLTIPMGYPTSIVFKLNTVKIAKYLFERELDLETDESSSLASAISYGNRNLFDFLLSIGANVNYLPKKISYRSQQAFQAGWKTRENPWFAAIFYYENSINVIKSHPDFNGIIASQLEFFHALFESGANLNFSFLECKNQHGISEGFSPLSYSVDRQLNEVVILLISYGADVNMLDRFTKSPLIRAVEKKKFRNG